MANITTPLGKTESVPFPGRIIKLNEQDTILVTQIQRRLNQVGCGPIDVDGDFGGQTKGAVKLFQTRFADANSNPLKVDGEIGPITWSVLFGAPSVPASVKAPTSLVKAALAFAISQIGVLEKPLGSNRGPEVDEYIRAAGLDPKKGSFAWCVAFTHFCYLKAAEQSGKSNPHIKTAGVLDHWNKAGAAQNIIRITAAQAKADSGLIKPGSLFIIDLGHGLGHSGMVKEVANGMLVTIEGNTNEGGSRNGIGVFERSARKINQINKGFIDYSNF
jgi:Putative peptidoglycan binding domain